MMTKSKERATHWYRWVVVLVLLLASSCGKRFPSDVDLEPLLIRPGDLPSELTPGAVRVIEPDPEVLCHDQALEQEIVTRNGELAGSVQVYLFGSKADRDRAYDLFSLVESQEGIDPYPVPLIGDSASARYVDEGLEVVFVRCYAVAAIWLKTSGDYTIKANDVVHYAQQLDQRLASEVCP
jgi:hypothetical protein